MTHEMTESEVKAVRWVEHILAPLIVLAILSLFGFTMSSRETMAELRKTQEAERDNRDMITRDIEVIKREQRVIITNQRELEKGMERAKTNQEYMRDELKRVSKQSEQILQILTDRQ